MLREVPEMGMAKTSWVLWKCFQSHFKMNSFCSSLAAVRGIDGEEGKASELRDFKNTLGNVPKQPQTLPGDPIRILESSNCTYQTVQGRKLGSCSCWVEGAGCDGVPEVSSSTAQEKPLLCCAAPAMSQGALQETRSKMH